MKKSNTIVGIIIVLAIIVGIYYLSSSSSGNTPAADQTQTPAATQPSDTAQASTPSGAKTPAKNPVPNNGPETVIGASAAGNKIMAYHFGSGPTELMFVGGIHGGYEWNTVLVANQLMDYLKANPSEIPANEKITVIPVLNPDGLYKVIGKNTSNFTPADVSSSAETVISGRFNGDNVDLNRNFDCDWQALGKWQTKTVSGGRAPFSEPESKAIKNYVETNKPAAVLVWFSAAGGVYASNCHTGVSADTNALTKKFADVSGYPAYQSFDFYGITGDMTNWLAQINIPAISVLLTNHTDTDWNKNLIGIQALIKYYSK